MEGRDTLTLVLMTAPLSYVRSNLTDPQILVIQNCNSSMLTRLLQFYDLVLL